jgi:type IV pilus assembly protein PilV
MTIPSLHSKVSKQRRQSGFSLVEVLVSVVVLSIGVLGAVGMQVASLQSGREVRNQAMAGSMAKELAERMRGNHAIALQASSTNNPYLLATRIPKIATFSTPSPNCATTTCTPIQIAAWDIVEWQTRMRDALPAPQVVVCMDSTPFVDGFPRWDCDNQGNVAVLKLSWNRSNTKGELTFTDGANPTLPLLVLPLTAGSSE